MKPPKPAYVPKAPRIKDVAKLLLTSKELVVFNKNSKKPETRKCFLYKQPSYITKDYTNKSNTKALIYTLLARLDVDDSKLLVEDDSDDNESLND